MSQPVLARVFVRSARRCRPDVVLTVRDNVLVIDGSADGKLVTSTASDAVIAFTIFFTSGVTLPSASRGRLTSSRRPSSSRSCSSSLLPDWRLKVRARLRPNGCSICGQSDQPGRCAAVSKPSASALSRSHGNHAPCGNDAFLVASRRPASTNRLTKFHQQQLAMR